LPIGSISAQEKVPASELFANVDTTMAMSLFLFGSKSKGSNQIAFRRSPRSATLAIKKHVIVMHYRLPSLRFQVSRGMRLIVLLLGLVTASFGQPLEKAVVFLSWKAQPEMGGFVQALNAGIYKKYGLDTELKIGSPQTNAEIVLSLHKADFIAVTGGESINFLRQNIPTVTVAAIFQKSPRVLIAHAGRGSDTLEEMKGKPILMGSQAMTTVWPFLRMRYGFTDDQIRPFIFNEAPFLRKPDAIQEGYVTEEPYLLDQLGVRKPVVILLSDHGYQEYTQAITTNRDTVEKRPDFVQRFVNASIEGWYSYLYGDPAPGNRFIKDNNPDISDGQIAYAIRAMKEQGIVDSGDAKRLGIGAMSDARWAAFYQTLVDAGAAPPGLDIRKAYTLRFVNKGFGM
jgi:NitT/TauT family transport system substrate-binding protein